MNTQKITQRLRFTLLAVLAMLFASQLQAQEVRQKRQFRGAWIQCVNGQFLGLGTQEMQRTLRYQLDELQKDGVNAIIFQVRAECDALYPSSYEPWSRFLTGRQGTPPSPYWDPLQWMIDECHRRGMELHAWHLLISASDNPTIVFPKPIQKGYGSGFVPKSGRKKNGRQSL